MESGQQDDLVVIGAGLSGISFARFYLDTHPQAALTIIEKDFVIGGVWSSSRTYEGFWTQSSQRISGFSDAAVAVPLDAPTHYDFYEAKYMTEYLEKYVDNHVYDGKSLRSRIRFGLDVHALDNVQGTWTITASDATGSSVTIRCPKLIIATGMTSVPKMPFLPSQNQFVNPIYHNRDFAKICPELLNTSKYTNVTVIGGGKSSADMAYVSVKAGKTVNWIIPETGKGPAEFSDPRGPSPYRNALERVMTRNATAMNPSCFAIMPWWARLLHWLPIGGWIMRRRATATDQRFRAYANYHHRPGALPSFSKLEPQISFFWSNGPTAVMQHDDFWDAIAKNVQVHRSDIGHMKSTSIMLEDGSDIATDIVLCGTGWETRYPFLSQEQACNLGLPSDPKLQPAEHRNVWESLGEQADRRVLRSFPMLANPPPPGQLEGKLTPARLYNGIAPLEDRSIIFLGRVYIANFFRNAEAQAIWATAYLDNHRLMPPAEEARQQVAYMNAFSKWRYPSFGSDGLYFLWDTMGYTDKLLRDVGLKSHRKEWWTNWDVPCFASDLRDVKDEYLSLRKEAVVKNLSSSESSESDQ